MYYHSTLNKGLMATFEYAVLSGLSPDGGLWMPAEFPKVYNGEAIRKDHVLHDVSLQLLSPFLSSDFSKQEINDIIQESFNFPVPVSALNPALRIVELFRGPTLAFKDFGARFMARVLSALAARKNTELTILVATSGDTGSAVAGGFFNVPGMKVIILYPKGKVSRLQEMQLTTYGGNVTALRINGNFDDCQRLVKQAFSDKTLRDRKSLTSANSINIARLLPQMVYYGYASHLLHHTDHTKTIFVVPSGNLGNVTAGMMAKRMGFPIGNFIIAVNSNKTVPEYLERNEYHPRPSLSTISNAMDVGDPSNIYRIMSLYNHDLSQMKDDISSVSISDKETEQNIRYAYDTAAYVCDPHTAVGIAALRQYQTNHPGAKGVVMSTAHPGKFPDVVEKVIGRKLVMPDALKKLVDKEQQALDLPGDYEQLRRFILSH